MAHDGNLSYLLEIVQHLVLREFSSMKMLGLMLILFIVNIKICLEIYKFHFLLNMFKLWVFERFCWVGCLLLRLFCCWAELLNY